MHNDKLRRLGDFEQVNAARNRRFRTVHPASSRQFAYDEILGMLELIMNVVISIKGTIPRMNKCYGTISVFVCVGSLLAACAGCWQEVHYDPGKPLAGTPVVNELADQGSEPDDSATNDDLGREHIVAPEKLSADELFGVSEQSPARTDATTPGAEHADADEEAGDSEEIESHELSVSIGSDFNAPMSPGVDSEEPISSVTTEIATVEESDTAHAEVMRPSRTALAVWRMSSRWSLAAAIYAKGQPEDRYRDSLDQATYAADLIGVDLPGFPVSEGMELESVMISHLLDQNTVAFLNKLSEDYLPEFQSLAELAIRTNALLLIYTPKSQRLDPLIASIRNSAVNSGLPPELWSELVSMLERREPFADVKQRLLSFHIEVGDFLAGQE
jgi:hypothetical protein